ncbi:hypothetical protein ABMY26_01860 [Azospirillum sp. HJ39]|uniref:hypothetical protein n=1 Tax=Azospirillum sp. HJ39 TaxID=3159496 RepID=UPI0035591801
MTGRFGFGLKAVVLGALVAGSMLGATAGTAVAHDDWRGRGNHGRDWHGPGRGGPEWRGWDRPRPHHRHWRERDVYYAPPPVIYAPPPRVIYAPPPVVYAPQPVVPGFGLSVNIR